MRILLALILVAGLHALQLQNLEVVSPIGGQRYTVVVPAGKTSDAAPADMGTDIDGCRHTAGPSEYEYYVVVNPFSYFAALASEWDERTGKFIGEVPKEVANWVTKEWSSEREIDWNHAFQNATQVARGTGQAAPVRKDFIPLQASIPVDKKYRLAISSYERRGARASVLAKIALTGAWAMRVRAQTPVSHPSLQGGFEEINARIAGQLKDGERFDLDKWLGIYKGIVQSDGLTREGYTVAASTLFGFLLRDGDIEGCRELLTKALDRLGKDDKPDVMRGLIRERRRVFDEHNKFVAGAVERFSLALRNEEIVRLRIPEVLLVVAECYRRLGMGDRACDWYLALSRLSETQPAARQALRFEGKMRALPVDKPYHVQLGWIADEQREMLLKKGVSHPGELSGPDRGLLLAITNEGLGTASYNLPGWKPTSGADQADSTFVLDLVGKAVLEHAFRLGTWPKTLGDLWEREVIRDRNRVNRFYCPATGQPLLYAEPPGDISKIAPSTVLVSTSAPVTTPQGPRYGAYCANARVFWVEKAPAIGQPLGQP